MEAIREKVNDLNNLILQGKVMDAFEKHYHPEVMMQENENSPVLGKEANRQRELDFLNKLSEFRGASVLDVAVGDNVSMVKWHYDYTHKDWGKRNYTQVTVQHWKDGQIIKEQFFYNNGGLN